MTAHALLADLTRRGATLKACGDRLVIEAPKGSVTEPLRQALADHKAELLMLLTPPRVNVAGCLAIVCEAFEAVKRDYVDGALALLDTDPELWRRFHETEAAIDTAAKAGPTEGELRAALTAHLAVIHECVELKRGQRERCRQGSSRYETTTRERNPMHADECRGSAGSDRK